MGMKRWDHAPGTCRALAWGMGPQIVVCHPCRRYVPMPAVERPFDPCPFVCSACGTRGQIIDAEDAPACYRAAARVRTFVPPKLRPKPTR